MKTDFRASINFAGGAGNGSIGRTITSNTAKTAVISRLALAGGYTPALTECAGNAEREVMKVIELRGLLPADYWRAVILDDDNELGLPEEQGGIFFADGAFCLQPVGLSNDPDRQSERCFEFRASYYKDEDAWGDHWTRVNLTLMQIADIEQRVDEFRKEQ